MPRARLRSDANRPRLKPGAARETPCDVRNESTASRLPCGETARRRSDQQKLRLVVMRIDDRFQVGRAAGNLPMDSPTGRSGYAQITKSPARRSIESLAVCFVATSPRMHPATRWGDGRPLVSTSVGRCRMGGWNDLHYGTPAMALQQLQLAISGLSPTRALFYLFHSVGRVAAVRDDRRGFAVLMGGGAIPAAGDRKRCLLFPRHRFGAVKRGRSTGKLSYPRPSAWKLSSACLRPVLAVSVTHFIHVLHFHIDAFW